LTSSYQIGPNGQGSPGAGTGTDGPAAGLAVQAGKQQPSARATVRAEHGNVRYTGNDTRVASALIAARRVAAERGQRGSVG